MLSGDLKVFKDIDIFTTNKYIGDILQELCDHPCMDSSSSYFFECDDTTISFISYKFGGLNLIVYNYAYQQPNNEMLANFTLSRFNHAVTRHSLIFYEDLNSFLLTEHSVVGKISKLIDVSSDEVSGNINGIRTCIT